MKVTFKPTPEQFEFNRTYFLTSAIIRSLSGVKGGLTKSALSGMVKEDDPELFNLKVYNGLLQSLLDWGVLKYDKGVYFIMKRRLNALRKKEI